MPIRFFPYSIMAMELDHFRGLLANSRRAKMTKQAAKTRDEAVKR